MFKVTRSIKKVVASSVLNKKVATCSIKKVVASPVLNKKVAAQSGGASMASVVASVVSAVSRVDEVMAGDRLGDVTLMISASDTTEATDTTLFSVSSGIPDVVSATDTNSAAITAAQKYNTISTADTVLQNISITTSSEMSLGSVVSKQIHKAVASVVTLSESLQVVFNDTFDSATVVLQDTVIKNFSRAIQDNVSVTDTRPGVTFCPAEAANVSDSEIVSLNIGRVSALSLADAVGTSVSVSPQTAVSLGDASSVSLSKVSNDTFSFFETLRAGLSVAVQDSIVLTEGLSHNLDDALGGTLSAIVVTESIWLQLQVAVSDTVNTSDAVAQITAAGSAASLVDATEASLAVAPTGTLSITESISKALFTSSASSLTTSDSKTCTLSALLADSTSLTDTYNNSITILTSSPATVSDSLTGFLDNYVELDYVLNQYSGITI